MKLTTKRLTALVMMAATLLTSMVSCNDTKSYSDLLKEEEQAVNWYLAQHEIETRIPEDSVFETGPDAPFYKMDKDGYVYMRVLSTGDPARKAKEGDRVYFTFMRANIKDMYNGLGTKWEGNAEDMTKPATSFFLGDTKLSSSTKYGNGIQLPMHYFGMYCEVELVMKSLEGFSTEMSTCLPFVYTVRYFPAEY